MNDAAANQKLAIIIPAYKSDFLAKALAGVARQTDQRFNLYVFDDASPADIQGIARAALGPRPFIFKRFEKNLGGTSLPQHWNRCVAETSEPWLWLFSDDDLMDDNCVAALLKFLEAGEAAADIVRFDGWLIDENDQVVGPHTFEAERESWLEYAYGHLMGWRRLFMQQLVFRRSAFERSGGFLDLPLATATDDAALIALARQKPVRQISGAKAYWRCSQKNITPDRSLKKRNEKFRAILLFLEWLQQQLQAPREQLFPGDQAAFMRAMDRFLVEQILIHGARPALANWNLLARTRAWIGSGSRFALLRYIAVAAVNGGLAASAQMARKLTGRAEKPPQI
jgi:glycosyltransferase involved in cell wall biosynthesis